MRAKFDSLKVGTLHVDLLQGSPKAIVKAAFVNTKTGLTHGWTTGDVWSKEVSEAWDVFRSVVEKQLIATHFDGVTEEQMNQEKKDIPTVMENQSEDSIGLKEWFTEPSDGGQIS